MSSSVQESQEEGPEYKNYSYIRHKSVPEQVPEEQNIHSDYDDYQQHNNGRYNV
jgi:hypothetical protein